jgi:hypothetical protein
MVDTRWASREKKGLAATLALFVALGSPVRALAQTPDGGSSSWSFPGESPAPASAPNQREPAPLPPAKTPAPPPSAEPPPPPAELPALRSAEPQPPAELPALRSVEPPAPTGPRFPFTVSSGAASVSVRGPGIEKPLTCTGTCAFNLWEGVYWLDIQASGRNFTVPVTVTEPQHVVIEKPNAGLRGLGIAGIILGGSILSVAGLVSYATLVSCGPGGPDNGTAQCNSAEDALPYWLAAVAVGAVVTGVGIGVFISNNKPSVEILPVIGKRARRAPETFIGLAPVRGSMLPGLSLQTSF